MGLPAKHLEIWGITSRVMEGCIACMYQCRYMSFRVRLLVFLQCSQHFQERLLEAFNLSIAHGMVGCWSGFLDAGNLAKIFYDIALKVLTLISVQSGWKAIMHNKLVKKNLSSLILRWNGLGIPAKMISMGCPGHWFWLLCYRVRSLWLFSVRP